MSERVVDYPVRDGKPMAESDAHADEMRLWCMDVLRRWFETRQPVYVSGNNFVYYREGDPRACVSPDVYVVRGAPQRRRDTFKVWEEGGLRPGFVLELTSKSTQREDRGPKLERYRAELEVPEVFLFDLRGDWIPERLVGYRLQDGRYQPIEPDARGRLTSEQLGLELAAPGEHLRFYEPGASAPLPTYAESEQALRQREQALRQREQAAREGERAARERELAARERAALAEAEVARLRAELERLRGE